MKSSATSSPRPYSGFEFRPARDAVAVDPAGRRQNTGAPDGHGYHRITLPSIDLAPAVQAREFDGIMTRHAAWGRIAMDLNFSNKDLAFQTEVRTFIEQELPEDIRDKVANGYRLGREDYVRWQKILGKKGWLAPHWPKKYGGSEMTAVQRYILGEELGRGHTPRLIAFGLRMVAPVIYTFGTEAQKKELIPQIVDGNLLLALAQHEKDPGYTKGCIKMAAKAQGDSYVLNGTKMFVLDANIANTLIVAAKPSDADVTLFLVDAKDPGLTISKIPTIAMDNTCEVIFKDVKVPKKNILGEAGKGYETLEKVMTKAAIAKAAEMIGGAKVCIDMTAEYAKQRVQYEKPIGGFQAIQHYMANMMIAYDTIYNYLSRVAWMVDAGEDASLSASILKAKTNENYKFIVDRAVQIHGGIGTTREYPVALYFRRAKAWEFVSGDTDYHTDKVMDRVLTALPEW